MSLQAVRAALETALKNMSPAISPAWEGVEFSPTVGVPYQRVNLLRARPDNRESGRTFVEQGILLVSLCYPTGAGPGAAEARADLVRTTFAKGTTFTASGQAVLITGTPEIVPAQIDEDRYVVPVRIPWRAQVIG